MKIPSSKPQKRKGNRAYQEPAERNLKILLTGFNKFSNLEYNPTEFIVNKINQQQRQRRSTLSISTKIFQTESLLTGKKIQKLILQTRPDAIICLGVSIGIKDIKLELLARNAYLPSLKVKLKLKALKPIIPNGRPYYWSTLPIDGIVRSLKKNGFPVAISKDAGTYECNQVFYLARYVLESIGQDSEIMCGFIHTPLMSEQLNVRDSNVASLPLKVMTEAINEVIKVVKTKYQSSYHSLNG